MQKIILILVSIIIVACAKQPPSAAELQSKLFPKINPVAPDSLNLYIDNSASMRGFCQAPNNSYFNLLEQLLLEYGQKPIAVNTLSKAIGNTGNTNLRQALQQVSQPGFYQAQQTDLNLFWQQADINGLQVLLTDAVQSGADNNAAGFVFSLKAAELIKEGLFLGIYALPASFSGYYYSETLPGVNFFYTGKRPLYILVTGSTRYGAFFNKHFNPELTTRLVFNLPPAKAQLSINQQTLPTGLIHWDSTLAIQVYSGVAGSNGNIELSFAQTALPGSWHAKWVNYPYAQNSLNSVNIFSLEQAVNSNYRLDLPSSQSAKLCLFYHTPALPDWVTELSGQDDSTPATATKTLNLKNRIENLWNATQPLGAPTSSQAAALLLWP